MKYIKGILIGIALVLIIFLFFLSRKGYILKDRILDSVLGDIDGDNENEVIVLSRGIFGRYGKDVVIYSNMERINELYREDFSELKPWKIETGDIDADGIDEITIGVYKKTIFHKVMDKRPFIYSYKDNRLHPKWRGSRLSRPLEDYTFYDIDCDNFDEIVSIELMENGRKTLNSYKWKDFGFEGFLEGEKSYNALELLLEEDGLYAFADDETKSEWKIIIRDGYLSLERMD